MLESLYWSLTAIWCKELIKCVLCQTLIWINFFRNIWFFLNFLLRLGSTLNFSLFSLTYDCINDLLRNLPFFISLISRKKSIKESRKIRKLKIPMEVHLKVTNNFGFFNKKYSETLITSWLIKRQNLIRIIALWIPK